MKTIIITLKGILLWVTAVSITLFIIGGFESLVEAERWLPAIIWLVINIILGYLCYYNLSYEEWYKLSGCQWFDKLFREPESPTTPHHDDPYEGLSDEELKEIWEDMQADYWIDIQKSQISEQ